MMSHEIPEILRYDDLKRLFKISRSSLSRWEQLPENPFPKRLVLGKNSIGWRSDQVKQWLEQRAKQGEQQND